MMGAVINSEKLLRGLLRMVRWAQDQADEELASACLWITSKLLEDMNVVPAGMEHKIEPLPLPPAGELDAEKWEREILGAAERAVIAPGDRRMIGVKIQAIQRQIEALIDGCFCDDGRLLPECPLCIRRRAVLARLPALAAKITGEGGKQA